MQKPSIGRIVHVAWYGHRVPAVITYIWSDTCVNVSILAARPLVTYGLPFGHEISSSYYEEETPESTLLPNETLNGHASWSWPPRTP